MTVAVTGIAAVSAYGAGWRGISGALASGAALVGVPPERPLGNPRARKMMSRGAYLAAACLADLLRDVAWTAARDRIGYYLGVGGSGGSLDDVVALLDASIADGELSLARFGDRGLAACNPLLAFQLMNNFTLCHGAILEGTGGPNAALFSRGAGTTAALVEAVHAIASGECDRAIAGGADATTNPVSVAELSREGFLARGLVPADGAALLALSRDPAGAIATIAGCAIASGRGRPAHEAIDEALSRITASSGSTSSPRTPLAITATGPAATTASKDLGAARTTSTAAGTTSVDVVVLAPWGPPAADALRSWTHAHFPRADVVDTTALGDSQAAGHALAWAVACDRIARTTARALVIGLGVDGDIGAAVFVGGGA